MNKHRSEECFEEIASRLEHEYIVNRSINGDSDRDKETFLYLLKNLAAFCHLDWDDMNVYYRASQLSKWPPYATIEDVKAHIAEIDENSRKDLEGYRRFSEMCREAGL
jgi:hypothetical protein